MSTKPMKNLKLTVEKQDETKVSNTYTFLQGDETLPDLTAGNIISDDAYNEDTEPYLFRALPYKSKRLEESLVGGTVVWNQLAKFNSRTGTVGGISYTIASDGTVTLSAGITTGVVGINADVSFTGKNGHVIYIFGCPSGGADGYYYVRDGYEAGSRNLDIGNGVIVKKTNDNLIAQIYVGNGKTIPTLEFRPQIFDLTQMFGTTIADYVYSLEQATAGSGIAWLKSYGFFTKPYYEYDAGTLKSVNPTAHVTRGVNAWDEEWEVGGYWSDGSNKNSYNGIRTKNYIPVLPSTSYFVNATLEYIFFYDENKQKISYREQGSLGTFTTPSNCKYIKFNTNNTYGTTYNNDICINISDPTINGKYFPYEEHTYDFGDVTLRGIPKLVNNELVYDGDIYEHDGEVTRKYGVVDLGTLDWTYNGGNTFYVRYLQMKAFSEFVTPRYVYIGRKTDAQIISAGDKSIAVSANNGDYILVKDSAYSDAATFKTAMSGVYLVYELATPTTETTDTFEQYQVCETGGTEEYTTTNDVPVGHETKYYTDVIGNIENIPAPPTTNGTYTLQVTVSSGVPTYAWV